MIFPEGLERLNHQLHRVRWNDDDNDEQEEEQRQSLGERRTNEERQKERKNDYIDHEEEDHVDPRSACFVIIDRQVRERRMVEHVVFFT